MKWSFILILLLLSVTFVQGSKIVRTFRSCCEYTPNLKENISFEIYDDKVSESMHGNPSCCKYLKDSESCYACFEEVKEERERNDIIGLLSLTIYSLLLIGLPIGFFIGKRKGVKKKYLNNILILWVICIFIGIYVKLLLGSA